MNFLEFERGREGEWRAQVERRKEKVGGGGEGEIGMKDRVEMERERDERRGGREPREVNTTNSRARKMSNPMIQSRPTWRTLSPYRDCLPHFIHRAHRASWSAFCKQLNIVTTNANHYQCITGSMWSRLLSQLNIPLWILFWLNDPTWLAVSIDNNHTLQHHVIVYICVCNVDTYFFQSAVRSCGYERVMWFLIPRLIRPERGGRGRKGEESG